MTAESCRSYDGEWRCERPVGHTGWHRAELGKPDREVGVALDETSKPGEPVAAIVSWT